MADETHGRSRTTPNQYSRLLEAKLGGHTLWLPHEHRGELGDCGYIMDGIFWRLFNVYRDPPDGLPRLPLPSAQDISTSRVPNISVFQSSHSSTVAFEASLPLAVPPASVSVSGRIASADTGVAFLACSGGYHTMDFLSRVEVAKLRRYLCHNYPSLQRLGEGDVFIVRSVMTASGWVGGVATRNRTDLAVNASFAIPGLGDFSVGTTRSISTGDLLGDAISYNKTAGPVDWAPEAPVSYPVVLGTIRLRKRDHLLRLLGLGATQIMPTHSAAFPGSGSSAAMQISTYADGSASKPSTDISAGPPVFLTPDMLKPWELGYERGGEISSPASSVASDDVTLGPPSILDDILDDTLAVNAELNAAVGDSALLSDFVATYGVEPTRENSICEWERVQDETYGLVAHLTEICTLGGLKVNQHHQYSGHWPSRVMAPPHPSESTIGANIGGVTGALHDRFHRLGGADELQHRVQRSAYCDPLSPATTRASRSRSSSASSSKAGWGRPQTPVSRSRSSSRTRLPDAMDTDQNFPPSISTPLGSSTASKSVRERGSATPLHDSDVSSDGGHSMRRGTDHRELSDVSDAGMIFPHAIQGGRDTSRRDKIESEMRRRNELRDAWRELKDVLPASDQGRSKVTLLDHAAQHIAHLEAGNRQLEDRLAALDREAQRLRTINLKLSETLQERVAADDSP